MTANTTESQALASVVVCMTIMAVCAVVYFAVRCYFEERRLRLSARLCKCSPAALASALERGDLCRYDERRSVSVAVQANLDPPATTTGACWTTSDIRMSEARRTACAFSSPLAGNQAAPNWRPPATGSSNRHRHSLHNLDGGGDGGNSSCGSHRLQNHPLHPHRRSRTRPSIIVNSPSAGSSDSYSLLTNNNVSKAGPFNRDLTAITFSDGEEERILREHGSRILDASSYVSPYHPRYNTPVSENNEDVAHNQGLNEEDDGEDEDEEDQKGDRNSEEEEEEEKTTTTSSSSNHRPPDGDGDGGNAGGQAGTTTADGATQSCLTLTGNYVDVKRCDRQQTSGSIGGCSAATGSTALSLEATRFVLPPVKGRTPSFEILPGGRLVTRWTQTDNASLASLDWDHYEYERLRSADAFDDDPTNPAGLNAAALLLASHTSDTTLLQASRTSQRSASSPYVLCFEGNEELSLNEDHRRIGTIYLGRRASTSSPNPQPRRPPQPFHQDPAPSSPTTAQPSRPMRRKPPRSKK